MECGVVKWFDNAKGWGFVTASDGADVFVHYKEIGGDGYRVLRKGQRVRYERSQGPRGDFATKVTLIDAPAEVPPTPGPTKATPGNDAEGAKSFAVEPVSGIVRRVDAPETEYDIDCEAETTPTASAIR